MSYQLPSQHVHAREALTSLVLVHNADADAEEGAEPTSRAADSSSLGSSKQPTTPQPPGCAAVETDGEAADDRLRDGPAAAAGGTAVERVDDRGGGGSQGGGSTRSALVRKGSDKCAPTSRHSRSQQQVRPIVLACWLAGSVRCWMPDFMAQHVCLVFLHRQVQHLSAQ